MSANILDAIQDLATPAMIKAATQSLGISEGHATSALAAASTSVLGGLIQHSGDAGLMAKVAGLAGAVTPDSNMFANLSSILTGGVPSSAIHILGNKLLGLVFGDKMAAMIAGVAAATGVPSKASAGLASLAAPMVLAALRNRLGTAPTAATLTSLLNADKSLIASAMPASLRTMYGLANLAPAAAAAVAATTPAVAAAAPVVAATVAPSVAATVAPAPVAPVAPKPVAPAAPVAASVAPLAAAVTAPVAAAAAAVAAAAAAPKAAATSPAAHSASGYASSTVTTTPSVAAPAVHAAPAAPIVHKAPAAPVAPAASVAPAAAAPVKTHAGPLPGHVAAATHAVRPVVAPAAAVVSHADERTSLGVLAAVLIPLALFTALVWYWAYGMTPAPIPAAPKAAVVAPVAPAPAAKVAAAAPVAPAPVATPAPAPVAAPVSTQLIPVPGANGMVKYTLPGGAVIEVAKDGLESKMLSFINAKDAAIDKGLWFDFDRLSFVTASSELTPDSKAQVASAVSILKAYPAVGIKVGGYTDNQGDAEANLKLSDKRAKRVMEEMVADGVAAGRIEAEGYGEAHPIGDNATPEGRTKNRRTSLSIRAK